MLEKKNIFNRAWCWDMLINRRVSHIVRQIHLYVVDIFFEGKCIHWSNQIGVFPILHACKTVFMLCRVLPIAYASYHNSWMYDPWFPLYDTILKQVPGELALQQLLSGMVT